MGLIHMQELYNHLKEQYGDKIKEEFGEEVVAALMEQHENGDGQDELYQSD